MKILNICDWDYAGVGIRLTQAVNQHTDHEARHLSMRSHRFRYPTDILTQNPEEIGRWIRWADVVNSYVSAKPLNAGRIPRPPNLILTYLGGNYRKKHEACHIQASRHGAKRQLVSITDLTRYGGLEWLPIPIPVEKWEKMKRGHSGKPIVCQTPSSTAIKHTKRIVELLSPRQDIELLIVTNRYWKKCMSLKAAADIYIGAFSHNPIPVSSLEAFAMGIPVINHVTAENEETVIQHVGYLPYYDAPLDELPQAVDALLTDRSLYDEYAELGKRYVKTFHDYPIVANRFAEICESVKNR